MGTEKRERQKANRDARRAEEEAAEAKARRIRLIRNAVILAVAIVLIGFVMSACGSSEGSEGTTTTTDGGSAVTAGLSYGTGECAPNEGSAEPVLEFEAAPAQCIDPAKTYQAEVETTKGNFTVELDTTTTPITSNNFVNLARSGYYDGTEFFRTEALSGIIQGGSPHTQSNTDPGPGYTIPDEGLPFSSDDYGPGALAMARTSAPNSASGQFFLLANEGGRYLGDTAQLGPDAGSYAVFGNVTEGLEVLEAIAALDDGTSVPSESVSITKVTITES